MDIPITLGNSTAEQAHNRLVRQAKSAVPMAAKGTQVTRSQFGTSFIGNANPAVRSVKVLLYQITALTGQSYVTAQQMDGQGNLDGTDEYVAKSFTGQMPSGQTVDTYPITYSYTDDNNRTADAILLGSEVQVCHPRYTVGDLIAVIQINDGLVVPDPDNPGNFLPMNDPDGNQITLYEHSPERFWCAAPDDYTPPPP